VKELCGRIEIVNLGSLSHWVAVDEIITQDKRRDCKRGGYRHKE
jgi:hypothetical protein